MGVAVVLLVCGVGAGPGCSSNSARLDCPRSVATYCASTAIHCSLTWDDVQAGPAMCLTGNTFEIATCGSYRKLVYRGTDTGAAFYYDPASGQLVAVVSTAAVGSITRTCAAGPPDGFEVPDCAYPDGAAPIDCGADGIVQ